MPNNHYTYLHQLLGFFRKIKLSYTLVPSTVADPFGSFFKGCWMDQGRLYIVAKRANIGEIAHEAAHIALTPKHSWHLLKPGRLSVPMTVFGEFMAIADVAAEAWAYAAILEAGIPGAILFREGFNGNGAQVCETFIERRHPGFVMLKFVEMSEEWGKCTNWYIRDKFIPYGDDAIALILTRCDTIMDAQVLMDWLEVQADKADSLLP